MTPKWNKIITQSKIRLKHGSPTILTCLGAIGVVATSVLAIQATPKAVRKIRADSCINHDGDPDAYTKTEAFQSAWLCYIPASLVGMSTIACIFGANILNKHQQATITSAYALLSNVYQDYERKTKEIFGEEGHQKIIDAIAAERADDVYISSENLCGVSSLSFGERNPEDMRLFYDAFSGRYFESTIPQVLEAEYHLNRNWTIGIGACINDLYYFLGISTIEGGDDLRWFWSDGMGWIDFNHYKTVLNDGLEVYVIDIEYPPRLGDEDDC